MLDGVEVEEVVVSVQGVGWYLAGVGGEDGAEEVPGLDGEAGEDVDGC